jgi:cytochrome oxidase Cu insertion factor (SCO1/SenC/PrrC family)
VETSAQSSFPASGLTKREGLRRNHLRILVVLVVLALAFGGVDVWLILRHNSSSAGAVNSGPRPTGIPAAVSTKTANLMALAPVPPRAAPGFRLVDQHSRALSLSDLRGKVVVLEFMDPHCTDICPLVAQEFVDAYHDLGTKAKDVVFAAVNVNQYFEAPRYMMAFTREHGLSTIPDWHFFTGSTLQLKAVWRDYSIAVSAPNPKGDIIHTSLIYFINSHGLERYLAQPTVDHTSAGTAFLPAPTLKEWGSGIATVAESLLRH